MKYKKSFIFICLIVCLFSIASISAGDVNDTAIASEDQNVIENQYFVVASEATTEVDNEKIESDIISSSNEEILNAKDNGTFTALQEKINNAAENATITLENDYAYDEGFDTAGISISKALTINGNGYVIDANSQARIFYINSTVTLKNITFINAVGVLISGEIREGGAIYNKGSNCIMESCTFLNCSDIRYGGAIYNKGANCNIISCTFTDCYSRDFGGAVYNEGANSNISSCTFRNCSSNTDSGCIRIYADDCIISSCTFMDCCSRAICSDKYYCIIKSCDFTNCSDGAIELGGAYCEVSSCTFTDCSSWYGGLIENSATSCTISSCNFTNCSSKSDWSDGGAISNTAGGCKINSCIFTECSSNNYGGAIFNKNRPYSYSMTSCRINSCIFIKCSAKYGGAVYDDYDVENDIMINSCTFKDCRARSDAGAVYIQHEGNISSCTFTNCTSGIYANSGAIYSYDGVEVKDSNFTDLAESDVGRIIIFKNCLFKDSQSTTPVVIEDNDTNVTTGNTTDTNFTDENTTGNETQNNTNFNSTIEPEITIPPLNVPSDDGSVTIKLPTDATGKVTLTINGKDYDYTVENGVANVIIPNLGDGDYPYTITYSGDSKYSSFTNNGSLKVNKTNVNPVENQTNSTTNPIDNKTDNNATETNTSQENTTVVDNSKIVASNVNVVYSAGSYYTITVYGTDGKLADDVSVKVSGKISKSLTTTTGIAKFKIDQVPGTYKITISAFGKSVTKTITVKKANPKMTAKAKTFKKSVKTKKYTITLKTNKNKVMKNTKVTIKIKKKTYTAKTNKKGVATFKLKKLTKKGKYTATITYKGNAYYNKLTKIVKITVK